MELPEEENMFKVIEQFICSKTGRSETCEDGLVITNDFIAVIDGASSKTKMQINGLTTGQIAKNIVMKTIQEMPFDIDCKAFAELATENIANFYKENNMYEMAKYEAQNRATCCVGVYSEYHNQIWVLGDIKLMIDGQEFDHTIAPDEITVPARVFYIACELKKGKTKESFMEYDIANSYVHGLVDRQVAFQNIDDPEYGYSVIDGFEVPQYLIKIYNLSGAKEVILSSDGYPFLENTLEKSEQELKNLMRIDPLCVGRIESVGMEGYRDYRAIKGLKKGNVSFDDRTYVRFGL